MNKMAFIQKTLRKHSYKVTKINHFERYFSYLHKNKHLIINNLFFVKCKILKQNIRQKPKTVSVFLFFF